MVEWQCVALTPSAIRTAPVVPRTTTEGFRFRTAPVDDAWAHRALHTLSSWYSMFLKKMEELSHRSQLVDGSADRVQAVALGKLENEDWRLSGRWCWTGTRTALV